MVGPALPKCLKRVNKVLENDRYGCVTYKGLVPYEELSTVYQKADGFIFASSCENQPIILIEAMTAGLPLACSNRGPMPEVLGENGFYFDPEDVQSIKCALKHLLEEPEMRYRMAMNAFNEVKNYTWESCANSTLDFLKDISDENSQKKIMINNNTRKFLSPS
jgi:glycosyltransferase involved in cell wall biosynthesis